MRARHNVLGSDLFDCEGREIGHVIGTWPDDGGWEIDLIVVRLPRFGEKRMVPADEVTEDGPVSTTSYTRIQVEDAPEVGGWDDADRARAYWMFQEPGILTAPWVPSSGSSATEKPSHTTQSRTTSAS